MIEVKQGTINLIAEITTDVTNEGETTKKKN